MISYPGPSKVIDAHKKEPRNFEEMRKQGIQQLKDLHSTVGDKDIIRVMEGMQGNLAKEISDAVPRRKE